MPVCVDKGTLKVTLNQSPTDPSTRVKLVWNFDDWFQEEPGISNVQTCWDLWEQIGAICIPNEAGEIDLKDAMAVGDVMWEAAIPSIAWLCVIGRCPHFWAAILNAALYQLQADIKIEVGGRCANLHPVIRRMRVAVRSRTLDSDKVSEVAGRRFPGYLWSVLEADRQLMEGPLATAVLHLAQAMEVAAYDYRRRIDRSSAPINFSPPMWFGPAAKRDRRIQAVNPIPLQNYADICELWGARNEWVHEGRAQVRPFDPALNDTTKDPSNYRKLERQDYYRFRSSLSEALVWMGEPAIE